MLNFEFPVTKDNNLPGSPQIHWISKQNKGLIFSINNSFLCFQETTIVSSHF